MTARQPPREKGAKACTIGCDSSRDGYFCAYFSGGLTKKESKCMNIGSLQSVGGTDGETHLINTQIGETVTIRNEHIMNTQLLKSGKHTSLISLLSKSNRLISNIGRDIAT